MSTLFVKELTVVDFSYLHPKRGIVGESWLMDVYLQGELNDEGMIFDFSDVKKNIKKWVDAEADHKLLVPQLNGNLSITSDHDQHQVDVVQDGKLRFRVCCPHEAICFLESDEVNSASLAEHLNQMILSRLPKNVLSLDLVLRPEAIKGSYYHYSHGLKKHQGDCQRIAHGHRSALEIYLNDQRQPELEASWCQRWQDIYLITEEDLIAEQDGLLHSGYQAMQGRFDIWVDKNNCDIITTDTTVELIAQHIAQTLAAQHPGQRVRVQAYEGVNKGAIALAAN